MRAEQEKIKQEKEKQEKEKLEKKKQEKPGQEKETVCQEKVDIPGIIYQGDDKKLKERVFKFKEGSFRIAIFTVLGLFMGYFSHTYVTDHFLPTKIILAIPYKLNEAIYVSILGTDAPPRYAGQFLYTWLTDYFPHSMLATFVAEAVTTVLIGGAIYGSLAYFTGDKRVFTLRRYLKFAGCWCAVILLTIGTAYGINAKAIADNEKLRGEPVFTLYREDESNRIIRDEERCAMLKEYLYSDLEPMTVERSMRKAKGQADGAQADKTQEIVMGIQFDDTRFSIYWVNCGEQYLATEGGKTYRISQEFAQIVWDYYENGSLPGAEDGTEEEKAEGMESRIENTDNTDNTENTGGAA